MKRVYSSESVAMAWHVRNVLEQHNIDAVVKNDKLYSVSGEVPFTECWPQVWVKHPLDLRRAQQLILEIEFPEEVDEPDWQCRHCGEVNLGNFAICWNCQQGSAANNDDSTL